MSDIFDDVEKRGDVFDQVAPAKDVFDQVPTYDEQVGFYLNQMKTNPEVTKPGFALTGFADPMGVTSYISKKFGTGEFAAFQQARQQYVDQKDWSDPEKWKNLAVDFEKTILELNGMPGGSAMTKFGLHSLLQAPTSQQTEEDWWTYLKEKGWEGAKSAAVGKLYDLLGIVKNPVVRRTAGAAVGGGAALAEGVTGGNALLQAAQGAVFTPYTGKPGVAAGIQARADESKIVPQNQPITEAPEVKEARLLAEASKTKYGDNHPEAIAAKNMFDEVVAKQPVALEIAPDAEGSSVNPPHPDYNIAATDETKNPWIRQTTEKLNKGRTLLVQFSSNLLSAGQEGPDAKAYYDKLYSTRPGYQRMKDFWEIPQWIGQMAHNVPNSDVYVVRNTEEAKKFFKTAKYDNLAFSALDVNKDYIRDIAKDYGGKIDVGGYVSPETFKDLPNVAFHASMEDYAKSKGLPYSNGVDYRHFEKAPTIARLCMSKGCLHKCAFCTIPKGVTEVTNDIVDSQVEAFKKLDTKLAYLDDKTFGQAKNHTRLPDIYDKLRKAIPDFQGFIIQTTAAQMNKFDDAFLQKSGIKYVELGVESYNDEILKKLHKPASEDLIDKAVDKLRKNHIQFIPNIVIGFPDETQSTYNHTLRFLMNNADVISHINVYNLALYEGSELTQTLKKLGTNVTKSDLNENNIQKSFHKNPEVVNTFAKEVYSLAQHMLDRPVNLGEPTEMPPLEQEVTQYNKPVEEKPVKNVDELADRISSVHNTTGGSTFDIFGHDLAGSDNYAVSVPGKELKIAGKEVSSDQIRQYVAINADVLKQPNTTVGTWYNEKDNTTYIDISQLIPSGEKLKALQTGREAGQQAIFNLRTLETTFMPTAPAVSIEQTQSGWSVKDQTGRILNHFYDEAEAKQFETSLKDQLKAGVVPKELAANVGQKALSSKLANRLDLSDEEFNGIKTAITGKQSRKDMTRVEADSLIKYLKAEADKLGDTKKARKEKVDAIAADVVAEVQKNPTNKVQNFNTSDTRKWWDSAKRLVLGTVYDQYRVERLFESLDGMKQGKVYNAIFQPIKDAQSLAKHLAHETILSYSKEFDDVMEGKAHTLETDKIQVRKNMTIAPADRIGIYMLSKTEAGLSHLSADLAPTEIKSIVDSITPQEKTIGDSMMKYWDEGFPSLQRAAELADIKLPDKIENYTTLYVRDASAEREVNPLSGLLDIPSQEHPGTPEKGRVTERVKGANQSVETDAFRIFFNSVQQIERFKSLAPALKQVTPILNDRDFRRSVNNVTHNMGTRIIDKWITDTAKNHGDLPRTELARTIQLMRSNALRYALFDNVPSVMRQYLSNFAMMAVHPKVVPILMDNWMRYASDAKFRSDIIRTVAEKSPGMQNRILDLDLKTTWDKPEVIRMLKGESMKGERGLRFLRKADARTTRVGWYSLYQFSLTQGASDEGAVKFADTWVRKTNSMAAIEDLPHLFRGGTIERTLTAFQNETNNLGNFMVHDIYKALKAGTISKEMAMYRVSMGYLLPALFFGMIGRARLPQNLKEVAFDEFSYLISPFLIVGQWMTNMIAGQGPQATIIETAPNQLIKAFGQAKRGEVGAAAESTAKGVAALTGKVGGQVFRTAEGVKRLATGETKDIRELIYSPYSLQKYGAFSEPQGKTFKKRVLKRRVLK